MDKRMQDEHTLILPAWQTLPDIGLYMDQVMTLMERTFSGGPCAGGMTKSMVNNYVKAGLIPRPVAKKYDRNQLAQLTMIAVLKQALTMEEIARVLSLLCANGAEAGYARFCGEAASPVTGEADCDAVSAAIGAACLVIRARAMIAKL